MGREKCGESEWIRGKRREGETKVLREGSERQIEAWGEKREYKEFPPSWNRLSALGQKNAKMFQLLLSVSLPPSTCPSLCLSLYVLKMSAVPLLATVDGFVFSSVTRRRAWVCGCLRVWELENGEFYTFFRRSGL